MNRSDFYKNTQSLMKLAYPILVAQLIQNLVGFADTVMAGRVSATDMAAVAVASSVWLPLILTIYGVIMAIILDSKFDSPGKEEICVFGERTHDATKC